VRHAKATSAGSTSGRASRLRSFFRRAFTTRGASSGSDGSGAPSYRYRTRSAIAFAALSTLLLIPSAAQAGVFHPFLEPFGSFTTPEPLAVDQANGDLYVLDSGAGKVLRFDSSGNPAPFSAAESYVSENELTGTTQGGFAFAGGSENQLAIAPPGSPHGTEGDIYVDEPRAGVIDVFAPSGEYLGRLDGSGNTHADSGGELCGVATDPSGDLYLGYFSGHVDKYVPTENPPLNSDFDSEITGASRTCNVAAGLQTLYTSAWYRERLTAYPLSLFPGNGGSASATGGKTIVESATTASVDPETDDLYVDEENHIVQFNEEGELLGHFGAAQGFYSYGVAIDTSGGPRQGDVYVSDQANGLIDRYGPGEHLNSPLVEHLEVTAFDDHSASFSGEVNSNGTGAAEETTYAFSCEPTCPGLQGERSIPTDGENHLVSDATEGLLPAQEYHLHLIAANQGGGETIANATFTTKAFPPDATTEPAQDIAPEHAVLEGLLNAHHAPTTYYFKWGETEAYGSFAPPSKEGDGGEANATTAVAQPLYGLQPHTTYHFRLIAGDECEPVEHPGKRCTTEGADQTFTTTSPLPPSEERAAIPGTGFLPDNRGWEQVSPPDKHGADVMVDSARTRAAATETPELPMAATFSSLGGFADVQGTNISDDYMAIRTAQPGTSGWATHGITPRQNPLTFFAAFRGMDSQWEGDLSPNLTRGVFRSYTPLTQDPYVKDVINFYRRDDLRTPGAGTYQLLTACPACSAPVPATEFGPYPWFAGASADFSHVIFQSPYPLVAGATAGTENPNLYEWYNGTVRLVGILPDSACATPPCVAPTSIAGAGVSGDGGPTRLTPHTISSDGSRIIFTDSSTGSNRLNGNLYMRIDGTETVQINASEKTVPDEPQPAQFQTASADGTRVFFTTEEKLTDAPTHSESQLYMYDTNAPTGHHLTLISADHEPADGGSLAGTGVIGASNDGHYVYFIASGQLAAGQPVLGTDLGLYEWHDGVTSYIGRLANLNATNDESNDVLPSFWALSKIVARVTPDGKHMLFQSSSGEGLTGYQSNKHVELYLYSAESHQLQCASCRPDGSPAEGSAGDNAQTFTGAAGTTSHQNHVLTDDGNRVFFTTTDALVPQDTNGVADAYEFDSTTGTVHLLSSGTSPYPSYFMDSSADGHDAFFITRQRLVGWDNDQALDLYDARVGGGLPDPPPAPVPCVGDGCRTSPSAPPAGPGGGSATFSGPGNPPAPKCHRHRHCRHRGPHHHHHHRRHQARPAGPNQGGNR
jgi:hypothetical protein